MRVLYVIHDFLPRHAAGSQVYAHDLAVAVKAAGHEVRFVTTEHHPDRPPYEKREYEISGIPVTELNQHADVRRLSETFVSPQMERAFAEELTKFEPQVVHYHHLLHLSMGLPRLVPDSLPQIFHLHDYWLTCPRGGQRLDWEGEICADVVLSKCARCMSNFYADISLPGRLAERAGTQIAPISGVGGDPHGSAMARAVRFAMRYTPRAVGLPPKHDEHALLEDLHQRRRAVKDIYQRIERFIAPSRFLGERLMADGLPREKLLLSDYGFASLQFPPRKERGPVEPLRVGYVGTLVAHKGVHHLIEAFAHLKGIPIELHLFGATDTFPAYTAQLRALAKGLPVTFHGGFAPQERTKIYSQIDALVLPAIWWENSPLTIHEAQLAALPVIVPAHGSLPSLITEGEDGLVYESGSARSLARVLADLAHDLGLQRRLKSDPARVKTIDEDAKWTLALYEELLEARR